MYRYIIILLFFFIPNVFYGQSIEESFSIRKMKKDLKVFRQIREKANSGLYKYRTKQEIDSIYNWAENKVEKLSSYRDFYNLICELTDFEGSLHNNTFLPKKIFDVIKEEKKGYFPFPIKLVENKVLINFVSDKIPLGAEIIAINQVKMDKILSDLYKYYTTDGKNLTGKQIGVNKNFSKYYRYNYGLKDFFEVVYRTKKQHKSKTVNLKSVSYAQYQNNFKNRHSKPFDYLLYKKLDKKNIYNYKQLDKKTGVLTLNSFSIGSNEHSMEHKIYKKWLDSIFKNINENKIINLVVDVRNNGGGTDPNDIVTYSYLTDREFKESKQVWISFNKIPFLRYYNTNVPKILRPVGIGKYNKYFQKRFPNKKGERYFISNNSSEMKIREPNKSKFEGRVYLLISPAVASAGSLFASMLSGNKNTTTIGEEAMGGYYGHNGHSSLEYKLPNSKIVTEFSIENIEQDVPYKENQKYDRGIIPDIEISQTYEDFLKNEDTQMKYLLKLIEEKKE